MTNTTGMTNLKIIISPVMYGFKTWSFTMREEHRLRVFENRVLRKMLGQKGNIKPYIKRSLII
jgi:hypothetical protein